MRATGSSADSARCGVLRRQLLAVDLTLFDVMLST